MGRAGELEVPRCTQGRGFIAQPLQVVMVWWGALVRVRGVENKGDVVVGVPLKELFACNTLS